MRNQTQRTILIEALTSDLGHATVYSNEPLRCAQARKLEAEGVLVAVTRGTCRNFGRGAPLFWIMYQLKALHDGVSTIDSLRFTAGVSNHHDRQEAYSKLARAKMRGRADAISEARKVCDQVDIESEKIARVRRDAAARSAA